MSSARHFRKYANRKFYDEERGRYASVDDIAADVRRGAVVTMTCDRTGRDLTHEILARILYEEIRKVGKARAAALASKTYPRSKLQMPEGLAAEDIARLVRLFRGG